MYESYFGLTEKPFSLNPDPDYLYLGRGHSRALAMLEYGVAQETGVVVITGEVGSGKTTLVRHLLNQLDDSYTVGMITNTHSSFGELIHWISSAFGLKHEGRDKVALYNQFVEFIISEYAAGRRVLVIVDEAQNMTAETLEELRVISNINADKDIVMQLVLVGQPELRDTLGTPELRQFVQRISAFYYLKPLEASEITLYIEHRLKKAGCDRKVFDYGAIYLIHEHSAGIPRIINTLCNLGLTYAFGVQSERVTEEIMREVVEDRAEHGLFGIEHLSLGEDGMRKVTKKKTTRKKAAAKKTTAKKTAAKKATTKKASTKKASTKKATSKKAAASAGADHEASNITESGQQTPDESSNTSNDNAAAQTSEAAGTQNQDLFPDSETAKAEAVSGAESQARSGTTQAEPVADEPDGAGGQSEKSSAPKPQPVGAAKDPAVVQEIVNASMFDVTSEFDRLPELRGTAKQETEEARAGEAPETSKVAGTPTQQSHLRSAQDADAEAAGGVATVDQVSATGAEAAPSSEVGAQAGGQSDAEAESSASAQKDTEVESQAETQAETGREGAASSSPEPQAEAEEDAQPATGTSAERESTEEAPADATAQASADAPNHQAQQAGAENDINSIERLFGSATNGNDTAGDAEDAASVAEEAVQRDEGVGEEAALDTEGNSQAEVRGDAAAKSENDNAAGDAPGADKSSGSKPPQDAGLDAILAAVEGVLADHERRDSGAARSVPSTSGSIPQKRPLAEAISDAVRSSAQGASAPTGVVDAKTNDKSVNTDTAGEPDVNAAAKLKASASEPAEATPSPRLVPRIEVNLNEEPERPAGLMGRLRSFFNGR